VVALVLGSLTVLWLANHALAEATDYDLGLYHLGVIEYAKHYAAIPGLANLQTRFAASDPHLLLAAFVDRGPWSGAGWHLVDGFLVSLLVIELGSRLARPACSCRRRSSSSRRSSATGSQARTSTWPASYS
jgi:hypothetical protein